MAFITGEVPFNPDTLPAKVVGIAADVGQHDSGLHQHQMAQLLFAPKGCITISLEDQQSVLPPTRAAWIPPGINHRAIMRNVVSYRSIYFSPSLYADLNQIAALDRIQILSVNSLLSALIERMAFWSWDMPSQEQSTLLALFWQELQLAKPELLSLPLPKDPRLSTWWQQLEVGHTPPPPLNIMAKNIGASEKTISRIFSRDTGMPYQQWRQQWRLLAAIEFLAEGKSVSATAFLLDFSSDSAFISFFRQHIGETPNQFMR
ncbi:AraC family transcriptional regulator [Photobacterium sanguinicancri]|uniref:AraC family transcriptional regulator n=1 Tax=Photobacterium sanguinicancri TaxID=875932 RepID=UPI003D10BD22